MGQLVFSKNRYNKIINKIKATCPVAFILFVKAQTALWKYNYYFSTDIFSAVYGY